MRSVFGMRLPVLFCMCWMWRRTETDRGIKCWILAIPALIGSAVLLSNPWTKAVYFINMVNYYKKDQRHI